jgi:hypothetical protein
MPYKALWIVDDDEPVIKISDREGVGVNRRTGVKSRTLLGVVTPDSP